MNDKGINALPAIEQIRQLTEQGWAVSFNLSSTTPRTFGMTARRELPGGHIEIQVRPTTTKETIESVANDLVDLCAGVKIRQIET